MNRIEWKAEVKKQLTLHGWTARDLAEMAGYSYSHVCNAMNGGIAAREMLEKVSAVLGIEPPQE